MRKILALMLFSCFLLSFCILKSKKNTPTFTIAFVKETYIDKKVNNSPEKDIINFIGVFPKDNDTTIIYQLNSDLTEKPQIFSYWVTNKNNNSVAFYCSESEKKIKVTFAENNTVLVENDTYTLNNEYYKFLKQKILVECSVIDLAFFLKDGYGDYSQSLEPLNKNWRNQKENNVFKIIKAKIKNRNLQTDDQSFTYTINYKYNKNGILVSVSGENSFNKNFVEQNNKHIVYTINRSINERASDNEYLYKNKKTLFDSIIGTRESFSIATTHYYTKYQSKLKSAIVEKKPKNIDEIFKILDLNTKELR
jgi:hypothetical protein